MAILNVTPDSFSDGGIYESSATAIEAGIRMYEEGADIIDVGGESTRPGAGPVDLEEELRRVEPVVRGLASQAIPVSIDTSKAQVAYAAIQSGAVMVNDVTAGSSQELIELCGNTDGIAVCLMHMQGEPRTMQDKPTYGDVVTEVLDYLLERAAVFLQAGVDPAGVWIDPGIGFGKSLSHNLELLAHLDGFVDSGFPVLVGVSRKSFLGRLVGSGGEPAPVHDRLEGTLAAQVLAQAAGVRMIRAHDVRATRRAIEVAAAILAARERP